MAVASSPVLKLPCLGALIALCLIWSIWYLEIPSSRTLLPESILSPNGGSGSGTHADDEPITLGLETISNDTPFKSTGVTPEAPSNRPLILYSYSEIPSARENLEFFIAHGLHAAADFIFILNGETDAGELIPKKSNIKSIQRPNDCYDLGAYAEVLTAEDLYKTYKRFIMLNASIRGPFLPYWSESCWSDMYLGKLTDEVKLVGMTANCWPSFHVQSMIWATDITGMEILLYPPQNLTDALKEDMARIKSAQGPEPDSKAEPEPEPEPEEQHAGINGCFHTWRTAVAAEVGASALVKKAGYSLDVMMSAYHKSEKYADECDNSVNGDVLWNKKYEGTNVHPYETIFLKSNRDIDPVGLSKLTEWTDGSGYSSYQFCGA